MNTPLVKPDTLALRGAPILDLGPREVGQCGLEVLSLCRYFANTRGPERAASAVAKSPPSMAWHTESYFDPNVASESNTLQVAPQK